MGNSTGNDICHLKTWKTKKISRKFTTNHPAINTSKDISYLFQETNNNKIDTEIPSIQVAYRKRSSTTDFLPPSF